MDIQIYGTRFIKSGTFGDFNYMCNDKKYDHSLFIFNDNEEQHHSCTPGGGNAIIRQYNKYNKSLPKPKSFGIPTGTIKYGGYHELNQITINKIDNYFDEIIELLNNLHYDSIYYSVGIDNKLGTSIFQVAPEVLDYIDRKIHQLSNKPMVVASN